jgi:hypothetical protein
MPAWPAGFPVFVFSVGHQVFEIEFAAMAGHMKRGVYLYQEEY